MRHGNSLPPKLDLIRIRRRTVDGAAALPADRVRRRGRFRSRTSRTRVGPIDVAARLTPAKDRSQRIIIFVCIYRPGSRHLDDLCVRRVISRVAGAPAGLSRDCRAGLLHLKTIYYKFLRQFLRIFIQTGADPLSRSPPVRAVTSNRQCRRRRRALDGRPRGHE